MKGKEERKKKEGRVGKRGNEKGKEGRRRESK